MTYNKNRIQYHKQLASAQQIIFQERKKQLAVNSILRLAAIIAGAVAVYVFNHQPVVAYSVAAVAIAVFLLLLRRHQQLQKKADAAQTMLTIAENELRTFNHDFSPFDGGDEYIDPTHDFSFDLDLFGNKSLFQQVNRTALLIGKQRLAEMFMRPLNRRADIEARQKAIAELAANEDFVMQFRTVATMSADTLTSDAIRSLFANTSAMTCARLWKTAAIITPILYVAFAVLAVAGIANGAHFFALYLLTLSLSAIPTKRIMAIWRAFDNKAKTLSAYSELFSLIAQQRFDSEDLQTIHNSVSSPHNAAEAIARLVNYSRNLHQSFVFPALLLFNPLLWNVWYALKIEAWMKQYASQTEKWFASLAKMDALASLATFASNRPEYTYPTFADTFRLEATAMRHPFIPRQKCIPNDIQISTRPYFMIVTGANMAGKSTYLRTVGVNHLLASMGAPVYAERFEFYPGKLLTNLRTADSLVNNESYFFAELKRLKMIIDRLKSGEDGLFVILDEILKGTNSEDKQKGSLMLVKRLTELDANGIIATHDLALGLLENEYPHAIKNFHFDADISGETLSFDYKLKVGLAQNMNASFLMRSMGIV